MNNTKLELKLLQIKFDRIKAMLKIASEQHLLKNKEDSKWKQNKLEGLYQGRRELAEYLLKMCD